MKQGIGLPLIVGGGIRSEEALETAYRAGADLVVLGNVLESETQKIAGFVEVRRRCSESGKL